MHKLQANRAENLLPQVKLNIPDPARASREEQRDTGQSTASPRAGGRENWANLLEFDEQLFGQKGIRLLTPEARVLIHLKLSGKMTVSGAMEKAGVSHRGFYAVLERLKQAGLVGQAKDEEDQRVRQLTLDPSMPSPPERL